MGLSIHFKLRLPASFTTDEATAAIAKLWQACHRLPFESHTSMIALDERRIHAAIAGAESMADWRWACIQHERHVAYAHDHRGVPYRIDAGASVPRSIHARVQPKAMIGFSCIPGDGCEPFNPFVGSYPASIMAACEGSHPDYPTGRRRLMLDTPLQWTGAAFTKTQYASVPEAGGITNFLHCHLVVIAALDAARDLGFGVEVSDEGGYWSTRSIPDLVRTIGDWNAYILGVGRQLRSVYGNQLQTAIDDVAMARPTNTTAATELGDGLLDLIRRTGGTCTPTSAAASADPATPPR